MLPRAEARCGTSSATKPGAWVLGHLIGHEHGHGHGRRIVRQTLVCDGRGTPLAVKLSPGQRHDSQLFGETLAAVKIPAPSLPDRLAADKAYSSAAIRQWLHERNIEDVIPTKSNQAQNPGFDKLKYRQRNVVERCISWLKEARRVATSYDKLARNFLAMVKLAMIDRLFRVLSSA